MEPVAHDRLCAWLELPPGTWPPDHYTLLGLPPGRGDVAAIEERVMERMERLRPHQLKHPELVTEGMNRLAQALVCLTDRDARAAYDRSLKLTLPVAEGGEEEADVVVAEEVAEKTVSEEAALPILPGGEEPTGGRFPAEPPAVAVDFTTFGGEPVAPADPSAREWAEATQTPKNIAVRTVSQRVIYRRLAALRRALRAWEALRPFLGTPGEMLVTPGAVLAFLHARRLAQEALPRVARLIREPPRPGSVVAAIVRSPHPIHLVRWLLPSQRQLVARDWQRGYDELQRAYARLREMAITGRPRHPANDLLPLLRFLRQSPEWLLVGALVVALALALLRNSL